MEEAKTQENAKLQSALQDLQVQFKETNELLVQERESAKKAAEKLPIIQEVPVIDHELMNKLTAENERLKVSILIFVDLPSTGTVYIHFMMHFY